MTDNNTRPTSDRRARHPQHKSAAWKASLLAAGLGAVALGWALFSSGGSSASAAQLVSQTDPNSSRDVILSQSQPWPDDAGQSGQTLWFDDQFGDDNGFWVDLPVRQGCRSIQGWGGSGFAAQPQFFGPMTRTRGS